MKGSSLLLLPVMTHLTATPQQCLEDGIRHHIAILHVSTKLLSPNTYGESRIKLAMDSAVPDPFTSRQSRLLFEPLCRIRECDWAGTVLMLTRLWNTPGSTQNRTDWQHGRCCDRFSSFQQAIEEILHKLGGATLARNSGLAVQFRCH